MAASSPLDTLFQVPLKDFTATRNLLAKEAGEDGAALRAIEKPSAAAWAVNQVYWRERSLYDKLVRASGRVRAGHAQILKGTRVDLAPLELGHRVAIKAAEAAAEQALRAAGDAATPATLHAVRDTLQALPVEGPAGRLTRPPAPVGFGALGPLLHMAAGQGAPADIVAFRAPGRHAEATGPSAKEAAQARRAAEREAAQAKADEAARRAKRRAAEQALRRLEERRARLRTTVTTLRAELETALADLADLDRAREVAEADLAKLAP